MTDKFIDAGYDSTTGIPKPVERKFTDGAEHVLIAGSAPSTTAATSNATSASPPEASRVIKASAGNLYALHGYNSKASSQFIQLHDSASLPANGVVPVLVLEVTAESNFFFDFGVYGRHFSTGIVVCNSSTANTKTIGSADCQFDAQYT
jgi:hypothetical protein